MTLSMSKINSRQTRHLSLFRCLLSETTRRHRGASRPEFSTLAGARRTADVLIVGGGPVGLSTAYHLACRRHRRGDDDDGGGSGSGIVVVERDPTYRRASATLSAGGIRQQFSLLENVQMSMYGRDFLRSAETLLRTKGQEGGGKEETVDVQFREHGYLFLTSSEGGKVTMKRNHNTQIEAGCHDILLLDPSELSERFPWLNTDDVLLGSYGERGEGWFDPWALISALRRKIAELGVTIIHGVPVGAERDGTSGRVLSVAVEEKRSGDGAATGNITKYHVDQVVNAGGPHASSVMDMLTGPSNLLRHALPVRPRKRCIFFFHCSAAMGVPSVAPLTVDPSLCYFRSEGSGENATFLCGVSPTHEEDYDSHEETSLDFADHYLFEERIWPALFHRVPAFGEIKVRSSWAGLYDYNTIDQNAIIGFHPEMTNVLMVNGFSGHGLQHSPAAGRAAAELLDVGTFCALDLSVFSFERFMTGKAIFEEGIV